MLLLLLLLTTTKNKNHASTAAQAALAVLSSHLTRCSSGSRLHSLPYVQVPSTAASGGSMQASRWAGVPCRRRSRLLCRPLQEQGCRFPPVKPAHLALFLSTLLGSARLTSELLPGPSLLRSSNKPPTVHISSYAQLALPRSCPSPCQPPSAQLPAHQYLPPLSPHPPPNPASSAGPCAPCKRRPQEERGEQHESTALLLSPCRMRVKQPDAPGLAIPVPCCGDRPQGHSALTLPPASALP